MVQRLMYIAIFRNLRGPIFLELLYVSKVIECVIEFGKVIDCFEELKTFWTVKIEGAQFITDE